MSKIVVPTMFLYMHKTFWEAALSNFWQTAQFIRTKFKDATKQNILNSDIVTQKNH